MRLDMLYTLNDDYLQKTDVASMAFSLETRAPFLSREVVEWGMDAHVHFLEELGATVALRRSGEGAPVRSDNGNFFLDCRFPDGIADTRDLEAGLAARAGIVESGLFLGIAHEALIASEEGVRSMQRGA